MLSSVWKMVIATILIITVSGCFTPEIRHEPVELAKPVSPFLPGIKEADMQCLSKDTYSALLERERLRKNYGEECIAIIDANNSGVTKVVK